MAVLVPGTASRWIARQALRRGLLGSSRPWFAVFVATTAAKGLRRVLRPRRPSTVLTQRLEPGAGLEVRHLEAERAGARIRRIRARPWPERPVSAANKSGKRPAATRRVCTCPRTLSERDPG